MMIKGESESVVEEVVQVRDTRSVECGKRNKGSGGRGSRERKWAIVSNFETGLIKQH